MTIILKSSLFTNGATYGKGRYNVPEQMPEETARELVRCGHAELIGEEKAENTAAKAERKIKTGIEKR